jgi:hypothetical protein
MHAGRSSSSLSPSCFAGRRLMSTTLDRLAQHFISLREKKEGFDGLCMHARASRSRTHVLTHPSIRASKIRFSQHAIRIKVVYLYLVGGERRGERRRVGSHERASSSTSSASIGSPAPDLVFFSRTTNKRVDPTNQLCSPHPTKKK